MVVDFMKEITKIKIENGYYLFKLGKILTDKNISINKLMRDTNTDFKVIKRLMDGKAIKLDTFVIARLCNYLNCSITDIVEYINEPKDE